MQKFLGNRLALLLMLVMIPAILSGCTTSPETQQELDPWTDENGCILLTEIFDIDTAHEFYGLKLMYDPDPTDGVPGEELGIISWLYTKIRAIMFEAARDLYLIVSADSAYQNLVRSLFVLVIMFFSAMVVLGLQQATFYNTFMMTIKMLLVWFLVTQWDFFFELIILPFESLVDTLSGVMANVFTGATGGGEAAILAGFQVLDATISMFLSAQFIKVILALVLSGATGILYAILFILLLIMYLYMVIKVMKTFLLALIIRFLLYALAPIFLVFALFNMTKSIFDGWLDQLINFSLQPIFAMAFLGMFNIIMMSFLLGMVPEEESLQKVCYGLVFEFQGFFDGINWWHFGDNTPEAPPVEGYNPDIPFNLWMLTSLVIIIFMMGAMADWVINLASTLSGGLTTVSGTPNKALELLKLKAQGAVGGALAGARGFIAGGRDPSADGKRRGGLFLSKGADDKRKLISLRNAWAGAKQSASNTRKVIKSEEQKKIRDYFGG